VSSRHLGSLGKTKAAVDIDFDWFGTTIRANPSLSDLAFVEFIDRAKGLPALMSGNLDEFDQTSTLDAVALVMNFVRLSIHPEDFDEFWALAKTNGQNGEDVAAVCKAVVEAATGFPTSRPSDSARGRSNTGRRSTRKSSSAVEHAMRLLDGRPDLQQVVVDTQANRATG
jgi:hypothetical protein